MAFFRERLHDDAVMLRSQVAEPLQAGRHNGLQQLMRRLAAETGTRMTVIALDGTVLADSEQEPSQMEPHHDRPEIVQAAEKGEGDWTHLSRTLGIRMSYLAIRVDGSDGRAIGFVRVALPMQVVKERLSATRRMIWGIALGVVVATLGVTWYVVARITRPLARLTEAAQAMAAGDYEQKVYLTSRDELGVLGAAFNRMSSELATRLKQIGEDRELLVTVLGGMIAGVVAVDAREHIFFANEAARLMLDLGAADLGGRPLWELVRHRGVQQAVQEALRCEAPSELEFETTGPVRRIFALHARCLPGSPCPGAVVVLHDVTELRRLENLRREFVANVSHELKTPLSSIKAYVATLLQGAIDDPDNNVPFLRRIEEQAERLHRLILELLRLARVESGQEVFEITAVSLSDVVATCVAEHSASAAAKRITLVVAPGDVALRVRADEEGLRDILNNLVANAIKYTPEGGRVAMHWSERDSEACIEVRDTGIGIAPKERVRIFERFYRVDRARSRELGGTGLGLSIVKHLAQAFGGSVAVASELGHGSTFTVRLPLA